MREYHLFAALDVHLQQIDARKMVAPHDLIDGQCFNISVNILSYLKRVQTNVKRPNS
jgi:hypothetical protein